MNFLEVILSPLVFLSPKIPQTLKKNTNDFISVSFYKDNATSTGFEAINHKTNRENAYF
ncbi:hypothetical protein [Helicobacter monodelphidis]|uniref:hypothetical protein n=1 Tax=Helicobacter sp. 15-1451 TaxID=2004995 RepID=UPI0015EBD706|nr:hypothetical protein [Helicobacter sp. 15-1451]